jgi:hypothetical protein
MHRKFYKSNAEFILMMCTHNAISKDLKINLHVLPESHVDSAMLESQGTLREIQVKQGNTRMTLTVPIEVGHRQFYATIYTAAQVIIMNDALANELGISGKFTCAVPGTYVFSVSLTAYNHYYIGARGPFLYKFLTVLTVLT